MAKRYNPNRTGKGLRPIIREPRDSDARSAGAVFAIHNAMVPKGANQFPGQLMTQPDIAGAQVKRGLGGGYFNPVSPGSYK